MYKLLLLDFLACGLRSPQRAARWPCDPYGPSAEAVNPRCRVSPDRLLPLDRQALAAILIAVALATLDTAIANTALPAIAADLHAAPAAAVWIVNAYQLAMVATLLPLAALGDLVGHRRVYLASLLAASA